VPSISCHLLLKSLCVTDAKPSLPPLAAKPSCCGCQAFLVLLRHLLLAISPTKRCRYSPLACPLQGAVYVMKITDAIRKPAKSRRRLLGSCAYDCNYSSTDPKACAGRCPI